MSSSHRDFESLSRGTFYVPFEPREEEDTPEKAFYPGELVGVYEEALAHFTSLAEAIEQDQLDEQLDAVSDWLGRCTSSPKSAFGHRVPVTLLQNVAHTAGSQISKLVSERKGKACILHARDCADLGSAIKAVCSGFVGPDMPAARRPGRAGIDVVERWYTPGSDLILVIDQAQAVQSQVLSELIYVLSLHPALPFRVILAIPHAATFLDDWVPLEPSSLDISTLSVRAGRSACEKILRDCKSSDEAPIALSSELAEEILEAERRAGGGTAYVLKRLKWSLLHHQQNNPLLQLGQLNDADRATTLSNLQTVASFARRDATLEIPGRELFTLRPLTDGTDPHDPSPRMALITSLSDPSLLVPAATGTELEDLSALFGMYKSAGKVINLYDWLTGYTGSEQVTDQDRQRRLAEFIRFHSEAKLLGLVRRQGTKVDEVTRAVLYV